MRTKRDLKMYMLYTSIVKIEHIFIYERKMHIVHWIEPTIYIN
jgi:hypothetical protein